MTLSRFVGKKILGMEEPILKFSQKKKNPIYSWKNSKPIRKILNYYYYLFH